MDTIGYAKYPPPYRYEEICRELEQEIQALPLGARLPSFRSLMSRFSSSQATVERALRKMEADGFLLRRGREGIFVGATPPARAGTVGFLVPQVSNRAHALFVGGGEQVARELGFRTEVESYGDRLPSAPPEDVEGLVLAPRSVDVDGGAVDRFLGLLPPGLRCVVVEHEVSHPRAAFVGFDDFQAGREAGEFLRRRGVRRLACVGSTSSHIVRGRLSGLAAGFGEPPETVIDFASPLRFDREVLRRVVRSGIDGLFVARPDMALQTLCFLESFGVRVPGDLAVAAVAEEGDEAAYPFRVATLVKPTFEAGRQAARALFGAGASTRRLSYRVCEAE